MKKKKTSIQVSILSVCNDFELTKLVNDIYQHDSTVSIISVSFQGKTRDEMLEYVVTVEVER